MTMMQKYRYKFGLTENAGRENDGPSKLQGMKLQDVKMMDQFAGREIAGHENDGPKMMTGREMAGEKVDFQQR